MFSPCLLGSHCSSSVSQVETLKTLSWSQCECDWLSPCGSAMNFSRVSPCLRLISPEQEVRMKIEGWMGGWMDESMDGSQYWEVMDSSVPLQNPKVWSRSAPAGCSVWRPHPELRPAVTPGSSSRLPQLPFSRKKKMSCGIPSSGVTFYWTPSKSYKLSTAT